MFQALDFISSTEKLAIYFFFKDFFLFFFLSISFVCIVCVPV